MDDLNMEDAVGRVKANGSYSYRVPSPHRVHIPPPTFTDTGESPITVSKIVPQSGFDLSFLDSIDCNYLYDRNLMLSSAWSYDRRRQAIEILPYLYLGPMTAARDKDALRKDGITMILGVAHRSTFPSRMAVGPMKAATELGLDMELIEVADNSELIAAFPKAVQAINRHLVKVHEERTSPQAPNTPSTTLAKPDSPLSGNTAARDPQDLTGKVLVFCESGNERSAAVVAAYLIQMFEGVDHIKACQMCNLRRFSTNFDDGLKQYLFSYYSIVKARRDVAAMNESTSPGSPDAEATVGMNAPPKRSFDVTVSNDNDVDAEMEDDIERFGGRSFAPFQDQQGLGNGKQKAEHP